MNTAVTKNAVSIVKYQTIHHNIRVHTETLKKNHKWITLLTSTYGFVWSIAPLCAALSGFVFAVTVKLIKPQKTHVYVCTKNTEPPFVIAIMIADLFK